MKLIDTNVLIFAANKQSPNHGRVRRWCIEATASGEPIGLPWIAALGFLRISTSPHVFSPPLSMAEALSYLRDWLAIPSVKIVDDPPEHWEWLANVLIDTGWLGKKVTDASLASLALCQNASLVSCDQDFSRVKGLSWIDPLKD
ncbi:Ribonuclease VapC37 [Pirellulimonas nuda]|uniref:Ribonuclease VapC n=1 Tax=Pirellulimonas nuda TaxID=2528009 RepID=A0A518D5S4_9BACT|nr:TA system VapC family ribonuclease toxin [Pirellulimonas nuda]QDU86825.1 Ribonuclease VapC37 [Pirellulimonas nuda]